MNFSNFCMLQSLRSRNSDLPGVSTLTLAQGRQGARSLGFRVKDGIEKRIELSRFGQELDVVNADRTYPSQSCKA